jgi:serine protease Do
MKRRLVLALSAVIIGSAVASVTRAQDAPAPPRPAQATAPPADFAFNFFDGGNFLGIHPEEITRENISRYNLSGEPRGVGIRSVVKGSPAERAGLRDGDVILRFDNEEVTSVRKLNRLIDEAAPEQRVRLRVLRGGSEQELAATLGKQSEFGHTLAWGGAPPPTDAETARRMAEELSRNSEQWQLRGETLGKRLEELHRTNPNGLFALGFGGRRIGVSTTPLGKQLADYFGVSNGVLIERVEAGSPAERAGLKAGDVITEAEGERISDGDDLPRLLNRKSEGEVTLTVVRDRRQRTVRVTPEKRDPVMAPGEFRSLRPNAAIVPGRVIAPRAIVAPPAVVVPGAVATPPAAVAPGTVYAPRVRPVVPRVQARPLRRAI